jgi:hypothetical protein
MPESKDHMLQGRGEGREPDAEQMLQEKGRFFIGEGERVHE